MIKTIWKKATECNKSYLISEKASFSKTQLAQRFFACGARVQFNKKYWTLYILVLLLKDALKLMQGLYRCSKDL